MNAINKQQLYITKDFKFDSAHNLVNYNGKCENLHGHTYHLKVTLKGTPAADGMIIDFGILKKLVQDSVVDRLDHHYLNDIVAQSTAENLIFWIWSELESRLTSDHYSLFEISLWETETSSVTLRKE